MTDMNTISNDAAKRHLWYSCHMPTTVFQMWKLNDWCGRWKGLKIQIQNKNFIKVMLPVYFQLIFEVFRFHLFRRYRSARPGSESRTSCSTTKSLTTTPPLLPQITGVMAKRIFQSNKKTSNFNNKTHTRSSNPGTIHKKIAKTECIRYWPWLMTLCPSTLSFGRIHMPCHSIDRR